VTTPATSATPATTPATAAPAPRAGPEGGDALALTLDPLGAPAFFADYRERRPLIVARHEPERFGELLTVADVDRLVGETAIRVPAFRLVKDGAQLPLADYTEDIAWRPGSFSQTAVVERVAEEFAAGATLVLQALHLHWPAAALYCRELEAQLGCPVQANAYLTPASAQGFAVHHDTHDVFVLQAAGRKRWRLYEPVHELPLKDQRWSASSHQVGPAIEEFTLEAGDTLYLPRGWPHEAETSYEESLHLTVGMHLHTRMDALRTALDECADDLEFRRSVGPDGDVPGELLERLAARLDPGEVARRTRRRFVSSRRPILHDQMGQLRALDALTVDTLLERRPTVIFDLDRDGDRTVLLFEGKEIRLPPQADEAVRALAELDAPFTTADLPGGLAATGRVVLVRRLIREGFLRALA
jgi:Cupin superfamily protein